MKTKYDAFMADYKALCEKHDLRIYAEVDGLLYVEAPPHATPKQEPLSDSTTDTKTLVSIAAGVLSGMPAEDRVTLFRDIAGDYCTYCGYKRYGALCYCRDDS